MSQYWMGRFMIITITILWLAILCVMVFGCAPKPEPIKPDPHNGYWIITEIIYKTNWVFSLGLLATAGGIFAFLNGKPIGLKIISTATALISVYFMYAKYSTWVAIGGAIGSVVLVGYSIYDQYRQHRIKDMALIEIVAGGEKFKAEVIRHTTEPYITDVSPINLFKETHNIEQSNTTKQIVEKVQEKLNGGVK